MGCSVASMNCGEVSCVPFLLNQLNMEEYKRVIRVGMISVIPVEDAGGVCEEVTLNRVVLSKFAIGDSIKDVVSF